MYSQTTFRPFDNDGDDISNQTSEATIERLKQELGDKDTQYQQFQASQGKQEQTYQSQISNLTAQIKLFELKFEQIDNDRVQGDKRSSQMALDNMQKIQEIETEKDGLLVNLKNENENFRQIIQNQESQLQQCQIKMSNDYKQIHQAQLKNQDWEKQALQSREREIQTQKSYENKIDEIIESQQAHLLDGDSKIQEIQNELETKDSRITDFEKQTQVLIDRIEAKNSELEQYQKVIETIEKMQKQAKIEIQNERKDKENIKISLEQKISEFDEDIKKYKKEISNLKQEKKENLNKMKEIQKQNLIENDQLKQQIQFQDQEFQIETKKSDLLSNEIYQFLSQLRDQQNDSKKKKQKKLKLEIIEEKSIMIGNQIISNYQQIQQENFDFGGKIQQMTEELDTAQKVKQEIHLEFERIRSKLELVKKWENEAADMRKQNNWLCVHISKLIQIHNKMSIQAFNQLKNIKRKFENNKRIYQEVNFKRFDQIKQEIKDDMKLEAQQSDFDMQMKEMISSTIDDEGTRIRNAQTMELINIVGEIANVLNFDIQQINLKEEQIAELKNQQKDFELAKTHTINNFKSQIKDEIEAVKAQYEQKMTKQQANLVQLEQINKLSEDKIRKQILQYSEVVQQQKHLEEQILLFEEDKIRNSEKTQNLMDTISELENQIVQINGQIIPMYQKCDQISLAKKYANQACGFAQVNHQNTLKAIIYLQKKYIKEDGNQITGHPIPRKLYNSLNILKFRRCVICVLFSIKIKKRYQNEGTTSTVFLLRRGLINLKENINRCITADNVDVILNNQMIFEGLIKIFNSKDYYNKNLFSVETQMSNSNKEVEFLNEQIQTFNDNYQKSKSDQEQEMLQMIAKLESTSKKYKSKKEAFAALQSELQNETIPIEEFNRVNEICQKQNSNILKFQQNQQLLQANEKRLKSDLQELENEKQEIVSKIINAEQEVQEKMRDIELKDVKIESLQKIIKKRGFSENNQGGLGDTQKLRQLKSDTEKLISDNMVLIKENDELKAKYFELETEYQNKLLKQSNKELKNQSRLQQLEAQLEQANKAIHQVFSKQSYDSKSESQYYGSSIQSPQNIWSDQKRMDQQINQAQKLASDITNFENVNVINFGQQNQNLKIIQQESDLINLDTQEDENLMNLSATGNSLFQKNSKVPSIQNSIIRQKGLDFAALNSQSFKNQ